VWVREGEARDTSIFLSGCFHRNHHLYLRQRQLAGSADLLQWGKHCLRRHRQPHHLPGCHPHLERTAADQLQREWCNCQLYLQRGWHPYQQNVERCHHRVFPVGQYHPCGKDRGQHHLVPLRHGGELHLHQTERTTWEECNFSQMVRCSVFAVIRMYGCHPRQQHRHLLFRNQFAPFHPHDTRPPVLFPIQTLPASVTIRHEFPFQGHVASGAYVKSFPSSNPHFCDGQRHPKCLRPMGRIQLRLPHSSSSRMTNRDSIGVCKA